MTALAKDRDTAEILGEIFNLKLAAEKVYAGGLACINATGYVEKGKGTDKSLVAFGRFEEQVDNSAGSPGDLSVNVRKGVFKFANGTAGDALVQADVGKRCYIVDDQTVGKIGTSGTRPVAGILLAIDPDDGGCIVAVGSGLGLGLHEIIAVGEATLSAGTGVAQDVAIAGVVATDKVLVSIKTNDTGANITSLEGKAAAAKITVEQTGGTGNDGVATYVVLRPHAL